MMLRSRSGGRGITRGGVIKSPSHYRAEFPASLSPVLSFVLDRLKCAIRVMRVRLYPSCLLGNPIFRNDKIVVPLQVNPIAVARTEVDR
jgi:hypothetical protein